MKKTKLKQKSFLGQYEKQTDVLSTRYHLITSKIR